MAQVSLASLLIKDGTKLATATTVIIVMIITLNRINTLDENKLLHWAKAGPPADK